MAKSKAVIIGTGGHAQMLWASWLELLDPDAEVVAFLESETAEEKTERLGLPILYETAEDLARLSAQEVQAFYFGIGSTRSWSGRWMIYQKICALGLTPLTLIHPAAWVASSASIAPGCFIGAHATVQPFAMIQDASIVNTGAIVEHHCQIGKNTHIAPGVTLCGEVQVGAHTMVGASSVVIQGLHLGDRVTLGAGSVLVKNLPDDVTAVGNPATITKRPVSVTVQSAQ